MADFPILTSLAGIGRLIKELETLETGIAHARVLCALAVLQGDHATARDLLDTLTEAIPPWVQRRNANVRGWICMRCTSTISEGFPPATVRGFVDAHRACVEHGEDAITRDERKAGA